MAAFKKGFLSGDDFETVLVIFCSYDYGADASEAVEKIATVGKEFQKCSLCSIKAFLKLKNCKRHFKLSTKKEQ